MRDNEGNGIADQVGTIIDNLPAYGLHHNNGLTFGPDGLLYLTLGSATNNGGPEEEPQNATILRMPPDGSGVEFSARSALNSTIFARIEALLRAIKWFPERNFAPPWATILLVPSAS